MSASTLYSLKKQKSDFDSEEDRDKQLIKRLQSAIEKHHAEEGFSVTRLAQLLSLSREHLWRICKKTMGLAPGDLIDRRRLKKAKRLLNQGWSARDTAFQIGMKDPAYFSRWFKNRTGMTVQEFKNRKH